MAVITAIYSGAFLESLNPAGEQRGYDMVKGGVQPVSLQVQVLVCRVGCRM